MGIFSTTTNTGGSTTGANIVDNSVTPKKLNASNTTTEGYVYATNADGSSGEWVQVITGTHTDIQADWNQSDSSRPDFIENKPTIPTKTSELTNDSNFGVQSPADWSATSGSTRVLNKPTKLSEFTDDVVNDSAITFQGTSGAITVASGSITTNQSTAKTVTFGLAAGVLTAAAVSNGELRLTKADGSSLIVPLEGEVNVQADWEEANSSSHAYIKNKPVNATDAKAGLMSPADKAKLDTLTTHTALNSDAIAEGTTNLYFTTARRAAIIADVATARTEALAAQTAAETAKNTAEAAATNADADRVQTEAARDAALTARNAAQTAQSTAEQQATAATTQAAQAATSAASAETSKEAAAVSERNAAHEADEAKVFAERAEAAAASGGAAITFATTAETIAGTLTTKAVNPAGVKAAIDNIDVTGGASVTHLLTINSTLTTPALPAGTSVGNHGLTGLTTAADRGVYSYAESLGPSTTLSAANLGTHSGGIANAAADLVFGSSGVTAHAEASLAGYNAVYSLREAFYPRRGLSGADNGDWALAAAGQPDVTIVFNKDVELSAFSYNHKADAGTDFFPTINYKFYTDAAATTLATTNGSGTTTATDRTDAQSAKNITDLPSGMIRAIKIECRGGNKRGMSDIRMSVKEPTLTTTKVSSFEIDSFYKNEDNGVLYLAEGTEANARLTPVVPEASATTKGIVELATTAEAATGTDAIKAVTPAGTKAAIEALSSVAKWKASTAYSTNDLVSNAGEIYKVSIGFTSGNTFITSDQTIRDTSGTYETATVSTTPTRVAATQNVKQTFAVSTAAGYSGTIDQIANVVNATHGFAGGGGGAGTAAGINLTAANATTANGAALNAAGNAEENVTNRQVGFRMESDDLLEWTSVNWRANWNGNVTAIQIKAYSDKAGTTQVGTTRTLNASSTPAYTGGTSTVALNGVKARRVDIIYSAIAGSDVAVGPATVVAKVPPVRELLVPIGGASAATIAEVLTGTDNNKAVTPAGLSGVFSKDSRSNNKILSWNPTQNKYINYYAITGAVSDSDTTFPTSQAVFNYVTGKLATAAASAGPFVDTANIVAASIHSSFTSNGTYTTTMGFNTTVNQNNNFVLAAHTAGTPIYYGYIKLTKSPQPLTVVRLTPRPGFGARAPGGFVVQGTRDGTNWMDIQAFTNTSTADGQKTFTVSGHNTPYVGFRLKINTLVTDTNTEFNLSNLAFDVGAVSAAYNALSTDLTDATTTTQGVVRLATTAEATNASVTTAVSTPKDVDAMVDTRISNSGISLVAGQASTTNAPTQAAVVSSINAAVGINKYRAGLVLQENELIYYQGDIYACTVPHTTTGAAPDFTKCIIFTAAFNDLMITTWITRGTYDVDTLVVHDGKIYKCKVNHTAGSTHPSADTTNWEEFGTGAGNIAIDAIDTTTTTAAAIATANSAGSVIAATAVTNAPGVYSVTEADGTATSYDNVTSVANAATTVNLAFGSTGVTAAATTNSSHSNGYGLTDAFTPFGDHATAGQATETLTITFNKQIKIRSFDFTTSRNITSNTANAEYYRDATVSFYSDQAATTLIGTAWSLTNQNVHKVFEPTLPTNSTVRAIKIVATTRGVRADNSTSVNPGINKINLQVSDLVKSASKSSDFVNAGGYYLASTNALNIAEVAANGSVNLVAIGGSSVSEATATAAGTVSIATTAEVKAGTDTDANGNPLVAKPSDIKEIVYNTHLGFADLRMTDFGDDDPLNREGVVNDIQAILNGLQNAWVAAGAGRTAANWPEGIYYMNVAITGGTRPTMVHVARGNNSYTEADVKPNQRILNMANDTYYTRNDTNTLWVENQTVLTSGVVRTMNSHDVHTVADVWTQGTTDVDNKVVDTVANLAAYVWQQYTGAGRNPSQFPETLYGYAGSVVKITANAGGTGPVNETIVSTLAGRTVALGTIGFRRWSGAAWDILSPVVISEETNNNWRTNDKPDNTLFAATVSIAGSTQSPVNATSNTSNGTIFSSTVTTNFETWKAFDGDVSTSWLSAGFSGSSANPPSTGTPHYVGWIGTTTFPLGSIFAAPRNVGTTGGNDVKPAGVVKVQGSNDSTDGTNGTWTDIKDITNDFDRNANAADTITVNATTAYKAYRISYTSNGFTERTGGAGGWVGFSTLQFLSAGSTSTELWLHKSGSDWQQLSSVDGSSSGGSTVEFATTAEAIAGTLTTKAVNPAGLAARTPDASVTDKGILRLASNTDTALGTDGVRAVTPAGLKHTLDTLDYTDRNNAILANHIRSGAFYADWVEGAVTNGRTKYTGLHPATGASQDIYIDANDNVYRSATTSVGILCRLFDSTVGIHDDVT